MTINPPSRFQGARWLQGTYRQGKSGVQVRDHGAMRERRRTRFGVIYDADRLPVLTFVVQVPVAWGLSDSDLTFQTGFLALWAQSKIPFPPLSVSRCSTADFGPDRGIDTAEGQVRCRNIKDPNLDIPRVHPPARRLRQTRWALMYKG